MTTTWDKGKVLEPFLRIIDESGSKKQCAILTQGKEKKYWECLS